MDTKKISFGFKAIKKQPIILNKQIEKKNDHELIDCLEGQSIKIIGNDSENEKKPLIIPLKPDLNRYNHSNVSMALKIIQEERDGIVQENENDIKANIKHEIHSNDTLEQKATKEILNSLNNVEEEVDDTKVFSLPLKPDELILDGAAESTLDDYESIPIKDFGMAMLRGMGLTEDIKRNTVKMPELRPKGMGLGADKMIKPKKLLINPRPDEILEIKRNAYVKILAGKNQGLYGQIEGFDDESGRIIVKLTISGNRDTLNEFMIQPVAKQEWTTYGNVLNAAKYEQYKNAEKNVQSNSKSNSEFIKPSSSTTKTSSRDRSPSPKYKSKYKAEYVDEDRDYKKDSYEVKNKKSHKERNRNDSISSSSSESSSSSMKDKYKKYSHKSSKLKKRNRSRSRSRDRYSKEKYKHHKDDRNSHSERRKKSKKNKKHRSRSSS